MRDFRAASRSANPAACQPKAGPNRLASRRRFPQVVLRQGGDRARHGNATVQGRYLNRAVMVAIAEHGAPVYHVTPRLGVFRQGSLVGCCEIERLPENVVGFA